MTNFVFATVYNDENYIFERNFEKGKTGSENWEKDELRLSDSFIGLVPENSMELVVKIIDVRYNRKKAEAILCRSEKLRGYSLLLNYVNVYRQKGHSLEAAIDKAVDRCIRENVLRDFLTQYGREVRGMLYDDISVEKFAQIRGEERWEEGRKEGREQEKLFIAKGMIVENLSDDVIMKITGLPKEQIAKLREEVKEV